MKSLEIFLCRIGKCTCLLCINQVNFILIEIISISIKEIRAGRETPPFTLDLLGKFSLFFFKTAIGHYRFTAYTYIYNVDIEILST